MCNEIVVVRKFTEKDINNKIKWINNNKNNKFLHYDLPLEYEKTLNWYLNNKDRKDRFDAVIEYQGIPVGIIGLLNIDLKNKKQNIILLWEKKSIKEKVLHTKQV